MWLHYFFDCQKYICIRNEDFIKPFVSMPSDVRYIRYKIYTDFQGHNGGESWSTQGSASQSTYLVVVGDPDVVLACTCVELVFVCCVVCC